MNIQQPLWRAPLLISDAEDVDELDAHAKGVKYDTDYVYDGTESVSTVNCKLK